MYIYICIYIYGLRRDHGKDNGSNYVGFRVLTCRQAKGSNLGVRVACGF